MHSLQTMHISIMCIFNGIHNVVVYDYFTWLTWFNLASSCHEIQLSKICQCAIRNEKLWQNNTVTLSIMSQSDHTSVILTHAQNTNSWKLKQIINKKKWPQSCRCNYWVFTNFIKFYIEWAQFTTDFVSKIYLQLKQVLCSSNFDKNDISSLIILFFTVIWYSAPIIGGMKIIKCNLQTTLYSHVALRHCLRSAYIQTKPWKNNTKVALH